MTWADVTLADKLAVIIALFALGVSFWAAWVAHQTQSYTRDKDREEKRNALNARLLTLGHTMLEGQVQIASADREHRDTPAYENPRQAFLTQQKA